MMYFTTPPKLDQRLDFNNHSVRRSLNSLTDKTKHDFFDFECQIFPEKPSECFDTSYGKLGP